MLGEVAFAVLGLLFLLTDIRVFLSTTYQTLFGTLPNTTLGAIALAVFAASALAPLVGRALGPRRALAVTAGVLGAATLGTAAVRHNWTDLALAGIAVVAGTWWLASLHAYRRPGAPSPLPVAVPIALAADFVLRTAFRTVPVTDQPTLVALPLVAAAVLLFLAAALAALAGERVPVGPGALGMLGLAALPPLLMLGETSAFNAAQVAAAAGLGLGPEAPGSTQAAALAVGAGCAAGALLLFRPPRATGQLLGPALVALGAAALWARLPIVSLAGGAALAAGTLVVAGALAASPMRAPRSALRTAGPLALGWAVFVLVAFVYHAYYTTVPVWAATAIVALAGLAVRPSVAAARPALVPAALVAALSVLVPLAALLGTRAAAVDEPGPALRVMTYNIHQGFDEYRVPSLEDIARTIEGEEPDVVLLQEVVRGWIIDQQHDALGVLAERLGMHYVFQPAIGDLYGNAILSRLPMSDVRRVPYAREPAIRHQPRGALFVRVGGILFVNTHLDEHADAEAVRLGQLRTLFDALGDEVPVVVGGDLNALPVSAAIRGFQLGGFTDLAAGAGADQPTSPSAEPVNRVDYLFGKGLEATQAYVVPSTASDHRPVVVILRIAEP
ncbi:MAG TPA: endonuclease/exonuclease/phosphatase family protein [Candidatus Limnocylindrales bacterium]|nr:endonuclease/exonuclease/phosphatase family protein [Candidatus Limnocylindrales bacterium]